MTGQLGQIGEDLVADYYINLGFKILEKNYIFPHGKRMGEIDLVASKDNQLVFVEVKTRSSDTFGTALDAVDYYKQLKLIKMVKLYMSLHPMLQNKNFRIDVASVDIDPVRGKTSNGVDNPVKPVIIIENAIEDLD